ncbi:ANTAR domain-containing protein [Streptomyces rimosus]|uniref:ANTAR domain-containing protein n=1 Tax=Streptomyces rimosus TaxID=1927 RepID=UPI000995FE83|nr:ANTAR domain-containing protein [Streptomyces rimosus]
MPEPEPAHSTSPLTRRDAGGETPQSAPATQLAPSLVAIEVAADSDRTDIAIWGDLDLGTGRHIEPVALTALDHSVRGLDLHLDAVHFCDCAGLGTLLHLRSQALDQNKTVTLRTSSRAIDRILDLTGTRRLFTAPGPDGQDAAHSPITDRVPHSTDQELQEEVIHLRRAMQTRPAIDLARGILMATFTLSPEDAWAVLVATSQKTNTKLHRIAQDLADSVQGTALPEDTQTQLAAAVATIKATGTAAPTAPSQRSSVTGQRIRTASREA